METLVVWGIPTAITGFFFFLLQRKLDRQYADRKKSAEEQEERALERDKNQEKLMLALMQSTKAAVVLSEATAKAVQRIPDAHCNGDMTAALAAADKALCKQKDFLLEIGIHSIYE